MMWKREEVDYLLDRGQLLGEPSLYTNHHHYLHSKKPKPIHLPAGKHSEGSIMVQRTSSGKASTYFLLEVLLSYVGDSVPIPIISIIIYGGLFFC